VSLLCAFLLGFLDEAEGLSKTFSLSWSSVLMIHSSVVFVSFGSALTLFSGSLFNTTWLLSICKSRFSIIWFSSWQSFSSEILSLAVGTLRSEWSFCKASSNKSLCTSAVDALPWSTVLTEAEETPPCRTPNMEAVDGLSFIVSRDGWIP